MAEDWERVGSQLPSSLSVSDKNQWLQSVVDQVAGDMHLTPTEKSKISGAKFDPRSELADAAYDKNDNFLGILVNQPMANFLTVGQLKVVLAHEIEHTLQPPEVRKDLPRGERDADFASARTYRAQRVLDTLEVEGEIAPSNRDRQFMDSVKDPHGTILQRQQAIIQEFSDKEPNLRIPPVRGSDALRTYTLPEDRPQSRQQKDAPPVKKGNVDPHPGLSDADRQIVAELKLAVADLMSSQDALGAPSQAAARITRSMGISKNTPSRFT